MTSAQRRFWGSMAILAAIAAWIVIAGTLGSMIVDWPQWAQLGFYVVAGVGWIAPLYPLFKWMGKAGPQPRAGS